MKTLAMTVSTFGGTLLAFCGMMQHVQCGGSSTPAPVEAAVGQGGFAIGWSWGGGDQDVRHFVESRAGTIYAAVYVAGAEAAPQPMIVALTNDGHELWRVPGGGPLMTNAQGDVWAFLPGGVMRISASGAVSWQTPVSAWGDACALASDGTAFYYASDPASSQVVLQAVGPDGSKPWARPLGGDTRVGGNTAPARSFPPPAVGPSGRVYVPCACPSAQGGIAGFDPGTGAVVEVLSTDAGVPPAAGVGVVLDSSENTYFDGYPSRLTSGDIDGGIRWTSVSTERPGYISPTSYYFADPALLGAETAIAAADGGLVMVSPGNGAVVGTVPTNDVAAVTALLAGGRAVVAMKFVGTLDGSFVRASASDPTEGGGIGELSSTATGTGIVATDGTLIWSDPGIDAASVVADSDVLYAIERDPSAPGGAGKLVAIKAPGVALAQGPWPMIGHDPGRTNSVAGSW